MPITDAQVRAALATVMDPDLNRDLVSLNMVKSVQINGPDIAIAVQLTTPACPMKDRIRADITAAVQSAARSAGTSDPQVHVDFSASVPARAQNSPQKPASLPGVKHVIAVGAGKGGVGKSTVAVMLAVGLARLGAKTGLLDGDIYGPSMPTMLGLHDLHAHAHGSSLVPFDVHGIKAMTIGKLVEPDKALIWRGPMAHGAFKQLALQTDWGNLDYLIVDLPPGTGDVPLTLAQLLPLTGAVVVCTPQKVAQDDARRAVRMFQQLDVNLLGVVENMSYFVGDDGKLYDIFGRGGAEDMAANMNLPFLGAIPIHMNMRVNADRGRPLDHWNINPEIARQLDSLCQRLAAQVSILTLGESSRAPTLTIR